MIPVQLWFLPWVLPHFWISFLFCCFVATHSHICLGYSGNLSSNPTTFSVLPKHAESNRGGRIFIYFTSYNPNLPLPHDSSIFCKPEYPLDRLAWLTLWCWRIRWPSRLLLHKPKSTQSLSCFVLFFCFSVPFIEVFPLTQDLEDPLD